MPEIMCTLCGKRPAYAAIWSWCQECTALHLTEETLGRKNVRKSDAKVDTIYVSEDGTAARTVDGIGFVYYDSEDEAVEDTGIERVEYIDELREDWDEDEFEADLYSRYPDDDIF